MLTILKTKAEEMESMADTIGNLYQIIKQNELRCYSLLREYIKVLLKISCRAEKEAAHSSEDFSVAVQKNRLKIKTICQIVHEFDCNYGIKEVLQ